MFYSRLAVARLLILPLTLLLSVFIFHFLFPFKAERKRDYEIKIISLRTNWDDAVSWDKKDDLGRDTQSQWANPSSNPFDELVIGDSRTYYKAPNIRTYFRFQLNLPDNAKIKGARLLLRCSYGGTNQPKLKIWYIDLKELPSFERKPWNLPLSLLSVSWEKEENNWDWETHGHYKTPDLKVLVENWIKKYGGKGEIGIVITNALGNKDNFKGICSFDDEPEKSAKLVIKWKEFASE